MDCMWEMREREIKDDDYKVSLSDWVDDGKEAGREQIEERGKGGWIIKSKVLYI